MRWIRIAPILGMFSLMLGACGGGDLEVGLTWAPPDSGGPVEGYILQHGVDDGLFVTLDDAIFDTSYGGIYLGRGVHVFRVAAWNHGPGGMWRLGPWSPESDPVVVPY